MSAPEGQPSPSVVAALVYLAQVVQPKTPTEIGGWIMGVLKANGSRGPHVKSIYTGPGTIASGVVGALARRGWATTQSRPDGLSGSAYVITRAGRDALLDLVPEAHRLKEHSSFSVTDAEGFHLRYRWHCTCGQRHEGDVPRYASTDRAVEDSYADHIKDLRIAAGEA